MIFRSPWWVVTKQSIQRSAQRKTLTHPNLRATFDSIVNDISFREGKAKFRETDKYVPELSGFYEVFRQKYSDFKVFVF